MRHFVTPASRLVEPFSSPLVILHALLASGLGRRRRSAMLTSWFSFLIYALLALAIPLSMVAASFALATRPKRRIRARTVPFESGVSKGPPNQKRFTISFYLTAMLFIVFDIEVFLLFWLAAIVHPLALLR